MMATMIRRMFMELPFVRDPHAMRGARRGFRCQLDHTIVGPVERLPRPVAMRVWGRRADASGRGARQNGSGEDDPAAPVHARRRRVRRVRRVVARGDARRSTGGRVHDRVRLRHPRVERVRVGGQRAGRPRGVPRARGRRTWPPTRAPRCSRACRSASPCTTSASSTTSRSPADPPQRTRGCALRRPVR